MLWARTHLISLEAAPPPRGDADATRIIEAERLIARSSFMETNGPGRPFTMMNRRQFVCAGAAGAAFLAGLPKALAATYDLIIKGGRVIDPSLGLDAVRDIAIAGGRIAAIEASIAGDAAETIDARGKIVAPGLIDIHTHA